MDNKINRRAFISNAGKFAALVSIAPIIKACEKESEDLNYVVNGALCTGCEDCLDVCNYDSIKMIGEDADIAFISTDKCAKCGKCESVCPAGAISQV
jgi:heterodisulfide reductase subunit A-like polyferredoxin